MAAAATPELVAAVCREGALGSIAAGYSPPDELRGFIKKVKALTSEPFGLNLFIPSPARKFPAVEIIAMRAFLAELSAREGFPPPRDVSSLPDLFQSQVEVALEEKVAVCSFTFGVLEEDIMEKFRAVGSSIIGTATSIEEAKVLELAGCDAIVAQGVEAGGHRGSFLAPASPPCEKLSDLVPAILEQVEIPVIAAGGIATAADVKAAFALGAAAVQLGTAFLTCTENKISQTWKERLLAGDETVVTNVVTGRFARMIRSRLVEELEHSGLDIPPYPLQHYLTQRIRQAATEKGDARWMAMFSGQGSAHCEEVSVAALLKTLTADVAKILE